MASACFVSMVFQNFCAGPSFNVALAKQSVPDLSAELLTTTMPTASRKQCHRTLHHFLFVYLSFITTELTRFLLPLAPLRRVVLVAVITEATTNRLRLLGDQTLSPSVLQPPTSTLTCLQYQHDDLLLAVRVSSLSVQPSTALRVISCRLSR